MRKLIAGITALAAGGIAAAGTLATSLAITPAAVLALIAGLPAFVILVLYPAWGLFFTVTSIPLEGLGRFTSAQSTLIVSVAKLFGLATLMAWLVNLAIGRYRLKITPEIWCLAVFCGIGIVSMSYTSDHMNGVPRVVSFVTTSLYFLLMINVIDTRRMLLAIIAGLLAATFAVGLFAIAQRVLPGFMIFNDDDTAIEGMGVQIDLSEQSTLGGEVLRSGGTSGSPHNYAANLLVAIPLYLFFMRTAPRWPLRLMAMAGLLVAIANLLLTHTRSGVVTCFPILLLMVWRGLVTVNVRGIAAGLVIAALLAVSLPASVTERLLSTERYSVEGAATLKTRLDYWAAGLEMLQENWLTGMGMGNFSDLADHEPTVTPGHAFMHNIYLQLFNEVGIAGFIAIVSFLAMVLIRFESVYHRLLRAGDSDGALLTVALQSSYLSGIILGFTMDYLHFAVKDWWFIAAAGVCLHAMTPRETARPVLGALSPQSA